MNLNKLTVTVVVLMLSSAAVFAADAQHDPKAPAPAADSHTADEPSKPASAKKSRKPASVKSQHKAPTQVAQADAQGSKDAPATDTHAAHDTDSASAKADEGRGSKRVRVKNRFNSTAISSDAAGVVNDAPAAPAADAAPAAKESNDDHAAPAASVAPAALADADTHADTHAESPTASAKPATVEPSSDFCNPPLKSEVAALFERWNASLRTGDPKKVAANYAPGSVLLPTVSNRARFTTAEKEEYFAHFLVRRPEGSIDDRVIDVDCNSATDAGLYTFRFSDGTMVKARYSFSYRKIGSQWLITSHHSSGMPEKTEVAAEHPVAKAPNAKSADRSEQGSPARGWVRYP